MEIKPIKTRIFKENIDLLRFIYSHAPRLPEKSILVITSKIVALAEGRTVNKADVKTKEKWIRKESQWAIPTKYTWLTIKDGMVMASAGIDESNAKGKLILLPKDSFRAADFIRRKLIKRYKINDLGVIITDSRTVLLRAGTIGVAIGYSGFKGVKDYRGTKDIFGRVLQMSRVDVADSLAAAAVFLMGEGSEQCPLALIKQAPVVFCEKPDRKELYIPLEDDMYAPLFKKIK